MSTPAPLALSMVDTNTGQRHLVRVEVVPLHRRSGRYPALCGEVLTGGRLTVSGCATCARCALQARGQPRRLAWARRALIATVTGRWRNTG
jgi:hypothetical protein